MKDVKDPMRYAPTLLLDLAAVRAHLDSKNDSGELITRSTWLARIGRDDWSGLDGDRNRSAGLCADPREWIFPALYEYVPQRLNGGIITLAGEDISGGVRAHAHHPTNISEAAIKAWISRQAPKLRDNTHMMFMYAEKDFRGKRESEFFFNEVLVGRGTRGWG